MKTMKKISSLLLALIMALSVCVLPATAATPADATVELRLEKCDDINMYDQAYTNVISSKVASNDVYRLVMNIKSNYSLQTFGGCFTYDMTKLQPAMGAILAGSKINTPDWSGWYVCDVAAPDRSTCGYTPLNSYGSAALLGSAGQPVPPPAAVKCGPFATKGGAGNFSALNLTQDATGDTAWSESLAKAKFTAAPETYAGKVGVIQFIWEVNVKPTCPIVLPKANVAEDAIEIYFLAPKNSDITGAEFRWAGPSAVAPANGNVLNELQKGGNPDTVSPKLTLANYTYGATTPATPVLTQVGRYLNFIPTSGTDRTSVKDEYKLKISAQMTNADWTMIGGKDLEAGTVKRVGFVAAEKAKFNLDAAKEAIKSNTKTTKGSYTDNGDPNNFTYKVGVTDYVQKTGDNYKFNCVVDTKRSTDADLTYIAFVEYEKDSQLQYVFFDAPKEILLETHGAQYLKDWQDNKDKSDLLGK